MGMKFRKSVKLTPHIKLNFSKKGMGVSVGGKHLGVSKSADGKVTKRASVGHGTGISFF